MTKDGMQEVFDELTQEYLYNDENDLERAKEFDKCLSRYIKKGYDIDFSDRKHGTLLGYAAEMNSPDFIKAILKYKPDPNKLSGPESLTPLARMILTYGDYTFDRRKKVYEMLREAGADINAVDKEGKTLFHRAFPVNGFGDDPQLFVMLLTLVDDGANLTIKDNNGKTAYDIAAEASIDDDIYVYEGYKVIIERYLEEKTQKPYLTPLSFTILNLLRIMNCLEDHEHNDDDYDDDLKFTGKHKEPKWDDEINDYIYDEECDVNVIRNFEYYFGTDCSIAFTGTLKTMPREDAAELAGKCDIQVMNTVTKNTVFLVVGENPGSELQKAKELGISTLTEEDFLKIIADDRARRGDYDFDLSQFIER